MMAANLDTDVSGIASQHFQAFTAAFLEKALASRWLTLFAARPARWSKIEPWALWDVEK